MNKDIKKKIEGVTADAMEKLSKTTDKLKDTAKNIDVDGIKNKINNIKDNVSMEKLSKTADKLKDTAKNIDVDGIKNKINNIKDDINNDFQKANSDIKKGKIGATNLIKNKSVWLTVIFFVVLIYFFFGSGEENMESKTVTQEIITVASKHIGASLNYSCDEGITVSRKESIDDKYITDTFLPIRDLVLQVYPNQKPVYLQYIDKINEKKYDEILLSIYRDFFSNRAKEDLSKYPKDKISKIGQALLSIQNHIWENKGEYKICGNISVADNSSMHIKVNGDRDSMEIPNRDKNGQNYGKNKESDLNSCKFIENNGFKYVVPNVKAQIIVRNYNTTIPFINYNFISYNKDFSDLLVSETNNYITKVKSGKKEIEKPIDAIIYFNASSKIDYILSPPLDSVSEQQYYAWTSKLTDKDGNNFICWDSYNGKGFMFKNIKKKFTNSLQSEKMYTIVGRYSENVDINLVNGQRKTIPVLTDVYVFDSSFSPILYDELLKMMNS